MYFNWCINHWLVSKVMKWKDLDGIAYNHCADFSII